MKRREFIGMAAAGAAGAIRTVTAVESVRDPYAKLAAPRVLGILRNHQLARELGMRYRATTPREDSARALADVILADLEPDRAKPLGTQLDERICQDFAAGRTVTLDGWILALTDARQCALYSLQSS
jgi:hypothetical protein